jgi:hypothetical protein
MIPVLADPIKIDADTRTRMELLLEAILDKLPAAKTGVNGELLTQSGAYQASYAYSYPYAVINNSSLIATYEHYMRTVQAWAIQAQNISYV